MEKISQYTLFVGTPMFSSEQLSVSFKASTTRGTIKKSFSLANEDMIPDEALILQVNMSDLHTGFSGAAAKSSSSPKTIVYSGNGLSGNIGSFGISLKSDWEVTFYPKGKVTYIPVIEYVYIYPVYDNTVYPHNPTLNK